MALDRRQPAPVQASGADPAELVVGRLVLVLDPRADPASVRLPDLPELHLPDRLEVVPTAVRAERHHLDLDLIAAFPLLFLQSHCFLNRSIDSSVRPCREHVPSPGLILDSRDKTRLNLPCRPSTQEFREPLSLGTLFIRITRSGP
jgi:hypothetical protein